MSIFTGDMITYTENSKEPTKNIETKKWFQQVFGIEAQYTEVPIIVLHTAMKNPKTKMEIIISLTIVLKGKILRDKKHKTYALKTTSLKWKKF